MNQTVAPTTKTGVALPEGSLSPSNYVGDPRLGSFIDWDSEFMQKGLETPAAANEHGTPSMWKGQPTGFGKLAGNQRPPLMPPEMAAKYDDREPDGTGTGTGNPYEDGIRGDSPYDGSGAGASHMQRGPSGPAQPAPAGVPPAKMDGIDAPRMPFADQLAPMFAAMGRPVPGGPAFAAGQNPRGPQNAPPTTVQHAPQHQPPPPARPLEGMTGAMGADTWIDWEGALLGLMGDLDVEMQGKAKAEHPVSESQRRWAWAAEERGELPKGTAHRWSKRTEGEGLPASASTGKMNGAPPPAPSGPPVPAKKPQPKPQAGSGVEGRGASRTPFTYGEDDAQAGAEKSLDAIGAVDELLKGLLATVRQTPAPRAPAQTAPRRAAPQKMEKSMSTSIDRYGRTLSKGIYAFRDVMGKDAAIPDEYLYDYLCSFIEEAYEHEAREPEHAKLDAKEQLTQMARAVMNELVQTIPRNANLMRATKKYKVTAASIEHILVAKGIYKPRADSNFTDDGNAAMGAHLLAASVAGDFAYSHQPTPFLVPEVAPVVRRQVAAHEDDATGMVKSVDPRDPHLAFQARHGADVRRLWQGAAPEVAKAAPDCPVHGGREIHKAMNLWNPMLPCTCHGRPNAHG